MCVAIQTGLDMSNPQGNQFWDFSFKHMYAKTDINYFLLTLTFVKMFVQIPRF